jgi:4-cresol dehydrogenase (hydroxylating) flavoprotein subunit
MTNVLPAGVDQIALEAALADFRSTVGDDAVLTAEDELAEFRDPYWYSGWDTFEASAVVQPASVEEIQDVLRIANEHRIPLWVSSQGKNNGYGGSSPRVRGSVVVSLRRMNRVLEINGDGAYAVVEPGVSFFDLYDAVRESGHKLWIDCPDLGWGSIIGNTTEYGVGYTPYGDHTANQCGMEVVLPTGDLVRTGMGAISNGRSWHTYKRSYGPSFDGLFFQSNLGIVTKMGVWLMPQPECYMPCWLMVQSDDDLGPVVDTLRGLMLDGSITGFPMILSPIAIASVFTDRSAWYDGEGVVPEEVIERICTEMKVGRWTMRFAIHGDEAIVDHKFAKVKEAFERIPGAAVVGTKYAGDDVHTIENPAERVQAGVPNLDIVQMAKWYGGESGGHIGFSPATPMVGKDAVVLRDLLRNTLAEYGLDFSAALIPVTARSFINVVLVVFDTEDEVQTKAAFDACKALVIAAAKLGYGEYRAHLDFMDLCAEAYDFNDHASRRLGETIKDALDPNGILMPGKQGVWPRHLRTGS